MSDLPIMPFASEQTWERWLEEHGAAADGVWLKLAKKDAGIASITYAEALIVALCFGWIDSQKRSFDAQYWLQKFTPRRAKSKWSKLNCEHATRLIAEGRMRPAGLAEVERARQDGRWDAAYAPQRQTTVPPDLQAALEQNPAAQAFFDQLDSRNRYAILFRIRDAKREETRRKRIEQFVAMLNDNQKIYD